MSSQARAARIIVASVGLTYAAALWFSGIHIADGVKQFISYLPTATVLLVVAWDSWLWRWPGLHHLSRRPRLDGTWRVTLMPTPESHIPEGGNRGPIPGFVIVKQTYWTVGVTQYTQESASSSHGFLWAYAKPHLQHELTFTYRNTPRQGLEGRSRLHFGTGILQISGNTPETISGWYFTDRYTKGDIHMARLDRDTASANYQAALSRYGSAP